MSRRLSVHSSHSSSSLSPSSQSSERTDVSDTSLGLGDLQANLDSIMSNTYVTMPDGTKVEVTPQSGKATPLVNVAQLTSEDRLALDKTKIIKQEIQIASFNMKPSRKWTSILQISIHHQAAGLSVLLVLSTSRQYIPRKVNEEYNKLPVSQKGGPTMLHLMIFNLLSSTDSLVHALTSKIKSLKLSSYPGEDVGKAVTHLRTLVRCLKKLKRRNAEGHEIDLVPHDLTKQLYDILQTSSCEEFNALWKLPGRSSERKQKILSTGVSALEDPELVLSAAQTHYHNLCTDGKWTGVTQNKATFPAFTKKKDAVAFLGQIHCHNCGGPHLFRDCTEPQDEARIKANRKRFKDAKKVARTGSSKDKPQPQSNSTRRTKWPPRPKKGEPNRTMIDGKLHYYHFKSSKWLPVDAAPSQQANVVASSNTNSSTATAPTAAPSTAAADMDPTKRRQASLALTKFRQEFSDAFSVLTDVFQE
ncbi:hypothetical protein IV203_016356 [Nitzschia inconspicua]|uniref:Uncharacterized protein n=1 Tax=Nitzschia inconspicua TaxID=303405 RepID=A0A9K3PI58_9STRA|nr:hypothetical protein IV203_017412 [Nitzschia inconspicua]KAG7347651.1 hypothetical protein IV203_016356 [Nitzschia inconspicua]